MSLPQKLHDHHKKMEILEQKMLEELDCKDPDDFTTHWHCNGVYVRQFDLPKGYTLTGKIHRHACINILLKGKLAIAHSGGQTIMEAPHIFISEPGEKKAAFAFEDSIFLNVHATEETDQEKLEALFTVPSFEALMYERSLLEKN